MLSLTFTDEAYESYQAAIDLLINSIPSKAYFVQITEAETERTFDAWLLGAGAIPGDEAEEWGDAVKIVPNYDNGATPPDPAQVRSVRAERVHVY